jgi:hypothetical protein
MTIDSYRDTVIPLLDPSSDENILSITLWLMGTRHSLSPIRTTESDHYQAS